MVLLMYNSLSTSKELEGVLNSLEEGITIYDERQKKLNYTNDIAMDLLKGDSQNIPGS
jgi:exonuclease VII small subunit